MGRDTPLEVLLETPWVSCNLIKHGYQVYKTGTTEENAGIERVTESPKHLTLNLSDTLALASTVPNSLRQEELVGQQMLPRSPIGD